MADRNERERQNRRFDEDKDFQNRGGALDRGGGSGRRAGPGPNRQRRGEQQRTSKSGSPDRTGAPPPNRMQPGPDTGYGPRGYRRTDERIQEDICDRLTQHVQIDASDIEVEVKDGEVTLKGMVEDRRIMRMVEANVEMIPGVVDVHNELRLRRPPTREEEAALKVAEEMADKFPGGPTPTGNAGYES